MGSFGLFGVKVRSARVTEGGRAAGEGRAYGRPWMCTLTRIVSFFGRRLLDVMWDCLDYEVGDRG